MEANYPTTKLKTAVFLREALSTLCDTKPGRDYHDRKAVQLLDSLADLLIAEARIEAWMADLGTNGYQGEVECSNKETL